MVMGLSTLAICYLLYGGSGMESDNQQLKGATRHLLNNEEELANYPDGVFTEEQLRDGAVILHVFGILYMFAALAIVCDEFFVPGLEVIAEQLNLQDDVAGATFMAAGGSAPELATSFVGTFLARSNVGFGTVVGSAVFNILFVIGACAVCAKEAVPLTWWPLARDATCYAICLGVLIAFFYDKKIEVWEAAILLGVYVAYVCMMVYNRKLEAFFNRIFGLKKREDSVESKKEMHSAPHMMKHISADSEGIVDVPSKMNTSMPLKAIGSIKTLQSTNIEQKHVETKGEPIAEQEVPTCGEYRFHQRMHYGLHTLFSSKRHIRRAVESTNEEAKEDISPKKKFKMAAGHIVRQNRGEQVKAKYSTKKSLSLSEIVWLAMAHPDVVAGESTSRAPLLRRGSEKSEAQDIESDSDSDSEDEPMDLAWPSTTPKRISYVILAPLSFLLYYTVPDVRREGYRMWYPLTFIMCAAYIAFFSYLMVWWSTVVGLLLGIPIEVMGLTILAIGTSVPDLLESIIVTRDGKGDMALSSSIGSNIFDVTVGLPLPWFLFCLIYNEPIEVGTNGLLVSVVMLVAMLGITIISIAVGGWRLTKCLGFSFFGLWGVFVAVSLIAEYTLS